VPTYVRESETTLVVLYAPERQVDACLGLASLDQASGTARVSMDARLDQCARTFCLSAMNIIGQWSFALRPSVQITRLSFADVPRNFVNAALANGWDM